MQATSEREATVCGRPVKLRATTGIVFENREIGETSVHGSRHSTVTSTTTRRQTWFIRDLEGREASAEFANFSLQARTGNLLSIIWIVPKGKDWGAYCLAYNHDQKRLFSYPPGVKSSFPTSWLVTAGWMAAITFVFLFIIGPFAPIVGAVGGLFAARTFSAVNAKAVEEDPAVKAFVEELDRIDKSRIPGAA